MPDPRANPPKEDLLKRLTEIWDQPSSLQKLASADKFYPMPGGDEALVPNPPQFMPAPNAVGEQLGRLVQQILAFAPQLQGKIGRVQYGPTEDYMSLMEASASKGGQVFHPEDFPRINILGMTNRHMPPDISMNPILAPRSIQYPENATDVLAHEVTHAAGYRPETVPNEVEGIIRQLGGIPVPPKPRTPFKPRPTK